MKPEPEDEQGVCMNCGGDMDFSPMHPWCPDCDEKDAEGEAEIEHGADEKPEPEWCLRTDGASKPLPCSYTKGHEGLCYFRF